MTPPPKIRLAFWCREDFVDLLIATQHMGAHAIRAARVSMEDVDIAAADRWLSLSERVAEALHAMVENDEEWDQLKAVVDAHADESIALGGARYERQCDDP